MPAIVFQKPALVQFESSAVSDHNRSPLIVAIERIEQKVRLASGRLRKYHVADKREFTISWDMLPEEDENTVDGFWGAASLIDFNQNTTGEFTLTVVQKDGTEEDIEVVFASFNSSLQKRWGDNYWNISVGLEEV